jgi:hypothetical protein
VGSASVDAIRAELEAIMTSADRHNHLFAIGLRLARDPAKVDDLVQTACLKVLTGDRPWDIEERPDLVHHLGAVMWSTSDHDRNRADNRRQKLHDDPDDEALVRDPRGDDKAADERIERKLGRWMGALRKDRAKDEECLRLLDSFETGCLKVAQQREDTGWSLADVRRVRRRLFDRAAIIMRTHPDDSGAYDRQEAP